MDFSNLPPDKYYRGKIIDVLEKDDYQKVQLKILNGDEAGKQVIIEHGKDFNLMESQLVEKNDTVTVVKSHGFETTYNIAEPYRLDAVFLMIVFLLFVVFGFMRWKGLRSLIGLGISILILIKFVVPLILNGHNPLLISFIGSLFIAGISIYLAHGFKKRSSLALISTLITIVIALVLSIWFVSMGKLFGMGTEEAFLLQLGMENINLRGLLLGGIVIGTLGVLDDVTTTQTAAIEEIHKANPDLPFKELYRRGFSVGREHMISMINTLALAYIGAAFAMFLLFYTSETVPLWVIANNEMIVEEIVRTLAGSIALLFAVPISTLLSAYSYNKK
jgi:uncharacterized membrane protein